MEVFKLGAYGAGEPEFLRILDRSLSAFFGESESGHAKQLVSRLAAKHHDRPVALRRKAQENKTAEAMP